ncbi:hypothetical protein [Roseospira visakhapatnamensis]|uniref:Tail tube protein n=1 Tax=Roseospira visakhapatnamensis TaxID=390880 RepID=A0A7W6RC60_9PROT|nr:hypothetical protein [Roseospira visakhapatnamensis]MBB4265198.1 hypothetical protein [Roseospira visakhapatnamensis]
MAGKTAAGAKLFIGPAVADPDAQGLTDYTGATWTAIGAIQDAGELGDSHQVSTYTELDKARVKRIATFKDGGEVAITVTFEPGDAGQVALIDALGADHAYKIELDDAGATSPTTFYFVGMCTANRRRLGDGSQVITRAVPIQVQSDVLEVPAA